MTTIKIIGEANEATIVRDDGGRASYECSKGMWCTRQDDIRWEDSMDDAIDHAKKHVVRHDLDDLAKINGPRG